MQPQCVVTMAPTTCCKWVAERYRWQTNKDCTRTSLGLSQAQRCSLLIECAHGNNTHAPHTHKQRPRQTHVVLCAHLAVLLLPECWPFCSPSCSPHSADCWCLQHAVHDVQYSAYIGGRSQPLALAWEPGAQEVTSFRPCPLSPPPLTCVRFVACSRTDTPALQFVQTSHR